LGINLSNKRRIYSNQSANISPMCYTLWDAYFVGVPLWVVLCPHTPAGIKRGPVSGTITNAETV